MEMLFLARMKNLKIFISCLKENVKLYTKLWSLRIRNSMKLSSLKEEISKSLRNNTKA